jgi:DNA-binding response OmpR family regulator
VTHKILLYGTDARVDEVGARLTVAGFTVGVVRDHTQCVALARQHSPSLLAVVADANQATAREVLALLTMEPATAALPLLVITPAVRLPDALLCFQGGVAGVLDIELPADHLGAQIRDLVGQGPQDPRHRQALVPGGAASLRRIGRYMQFWQCSAALKIAGPPEGDARICWEKGAFSACTYAGREGNAAAAALLQLTAATPWMFSVDDQGLPASGEKTEDSLDFVVDLASDEQVASSLPEASAVDLDDGVHVLLVDDDPSLLAMYERALTSRGFKVTTAADGSAGYKAALVEHPDLIVSDIMMPETDGWGFLGLVRGDYRVRETPFVLMSCHADFLSKLRSLDAGADDYLEKGLRLSLVVERLEAVVRARRQLRAAVGPGQSFSGQLITVGAQFLLRLLADKSVTGRLRVATRLGTVEIGQERGVITDARFIAAAGAELSGIEALETLLSLDDGHFSFTPEAPARGGFDAPFDSIADQLCAILNQRREQANQDMFSHNDALMCTNTRLRDFFLANCGEMVRPIATALFAGQTPREVLAKSDASPLLIEAVVKDLLRKGIARFDHQLAA